MSSFAIFRLPHADSCTLVKQQQGEPAVLHSLVQLNGRRGFVIAPFAVSRQCPVVIISPDSVQQLPLDGTPLPMLHCCLAATDVCEPAAVSPDVDENYAADFTCFHQALLAGQFQKLVLARSIATPRHADADPVLLFQNACQLYPRLFIALVSTPQTGTWLVATPEVLLQQEDCRWRSIALAGTMQLTPDELSGEGERRTWAEKDIREQRYVASFIAQALQRLGIDYEEQGPRTVRAANLVHLRSDFLFSLDQKWNQRLGDLLAALHPTPAVCGLPREKAQRFILDNEHSPRSYYSGFMGPLAIGKQPGRESATQVYVTLRCMQVTEKTYRLFAGGGLLADSRLQTEWEETEAKLYTMNRLIQTSAASK